MKRILSIILAISMVCVYLPQAGGLAAFAEEIIETLTGSEQLWEYTAFTYDNNTADTADDIVGIAVTDYNGTQTDIYVPAEIDGAQVRIGEGVEENGTITLGSGLRFVTRIDRNDSLVAEAYEQYDPATGEYAAGYEIGVKITAEGSDQAVYIPATKWQSEGDVFTSALQVLPRQTLTADSQLQHM